VLKGDMVEGKQPLQLWLTEQKTTDKACLQLQKLWLEKIVKEAASSGRLPKLLIIMGDQRWVMVPEVIFDGLIQEDVDGTVL